MTWLAITEQSGDSSRTVVPLSDKWQGRESRVLPVGSLLIETDFGRGLARDETMFVLHDAQDAKSHLSLHVGSDGLVALVRRLGDQTQQITLESGIHEPDGTVRFTYSWDVPNRRGVLSMEVLSNGVLLQKPFDLPLPLLKSDVQAISDRDSRPDIVRTGPNLTCISISDRMEPVGITPSLTAGTLILTTNGHVPVEHLRPGDQVMDHDGNPHRLRVLASRKLPARGHFRPIRLFAPYLGLKRDVVVAPEQRVLITGVDVEYLFSHDAVLVEARALVGTRFAENEPSGPMVTYYQLVFDNHIVLSACGAGLESLFIGNVREQPALLATTLLQDVPRDLLPVHKFLAYPSLRDYEALTLRTALLSQ